MTDTIQPILTPNPEYKTWVQYDQVILSMLIASLFESILAQVLGCSTSRALWLSLERMFTSQSRAREMHTQYKLATAKKGNQNMTDYFQKMHSLSDNLVAVGQPISSNASITYIFASLGQEYDPFVTSVQTRVDPLSLNELYGLLLTHEQRLEEHQTAVTDLSFSTANMAACNSSPHGHGGQSGQGFSSNTNGGHGN